MIELPEATVLAQQIHSTLAGKQIVHALAGQSPHRFAWYSGDPANYGQLLASKTIRSACAYGNHVEMHADDLLLVISTPMRYHAAGEPPPKKHQLWLEFADHTALSCSVQMWGGMYCFPAGEPGGSPDYQIAKQRPSPLSEQFDQAYWANLCAESPANLSAKAFLATEQRIPGLGNGVLQDILWTARIHPKRKLADLSEEESIALYAAVRAVLHQMTSQGGRDSERDLFGRPGGYISFPSQHAASKPCPVCATPIKKEAYMGGSIYYCPSCQTL